MKYGLVVNENYRERLKGNVLNYGDAIQWFAIENLYRYMGIEDADIVRLQSEDLRTYADNGQGKLILPINYMLGNYKECPYMHNDNFIFSEDVEPVFLGFSLKRTCFSWLPKFVEYFKRHEPIGCRDYLTYTAMKEHGIRAYLGGCLTATLPLRKTGPEQTTTYFVEAPAQLKRYIPEKLKEDYKFVQHQRVLPEEKQVDDIVVAGELLEEYAKKARLVVTSRLHAALPCVAMGIPVILAKDYAGYPFDLLPRFIHFYPYEEYDKIDWYPNPVEMEKYKIKALECARARLLGTEDAEEKILALHQEYETLYKDGYNFHGKQTLDIFQAQAEEKLPKDTPFEYVLWGISDTAYEIRDYMDRHYKNGELAGVIDLFRDPSLFGFRPQRADCLLERKHLYVITTTLNTSLAVRDFFKMNHLDFSRLIQVTDGVLEELEG